MEARAKPGPRPSPADEPPGLPRARCHAEHPTPPRGPCPAPARGPGAKRPGEAPQSSPGSQEGPSCTAELLSTATQEPSNSPSITSGKSPAQHWGMPSSSLPGGSEGVCVLGRGSGRPQERGTCRAKLQPHPSAPTRPAESCEISMLSATHRKRSPRCFPSSSHRFGAEFGEGTLPSPCPSHPTEQPGTHILVRRPEHPPTEEPGRLSSHPGFMEPDKQSLSCTAPSDPRSPASMDMETPHHLISISFPLIWGNALNSTIKLKVMCPDKSIKILFATPTDKSHPSQGLASCLDIWLILSRTHNNTRALKSAHLGKK